MYKKNTKELEKQLVHTHPSKISEYIHENETEILSGDRDFMNYMNERIKEKGLKKQEILLRADISQGYGYKLLTEEKVTRQRDIILRICYAAEFTLEETQRALQLYRMDSLYVRDPRDALIMACFNQRPGSVIEVNQLLMDNKYKPLKSSGVQE